MQRTPAQLHEDLGREDELRPGSDRSFGLVFAAFCGVVGALGLWRGRPHAPLWLAAAALFAAAALLRPALLAPANRAWTRLGLLLFRVVNPVVMALLFAIAIVPVGLAMKLAGRDPLRRRFEPDAPSYWIPREPPGPPPGSMKRQF